MELHDAVDALIAACRVANADPEAILQHFDEADIDAYGQALAEGWIPAADLPRWMSSTAATIASGRCLCWTCLRERGFA